MIPPLPPGTHLIHIGPQKTGSTAIQSALHRERGRLRELGWVHPGRAGRPVYATAAGLGTIPPPGGREPDIAEWHAYRDEVRAAAPSSVVISHEAFGRSDSAQATRVIEELGGERPHVVAVARRLDQLLPSQWQQRVKGGEPRAFEEWLRVVLDDRPDDWAWRNVWRGHDTVALLRRWADIVGPENVTLLVPGSDHAMLPRAFEQLMGLPEGLLEPTPTRTNRSLSRTETELVRRLNVAFHRERWGKPQRHALLTRGLVRTLVLSPEPDEATADRERLPGWALDRVRVLSEARLAELPGLGVRIVGDVDALRVPDDDPGADPQPIAQVPVEVAATTLEALAAAAVRAHRVERRGHRRQVRRLRRTVRRLRRTRRTQAPRPGPVRRLRRRLAALRRR
ncbi:hypothetical protein KM427_05220 [Nocardioides sp. LMS-CY]|uniref:hypothetical protein n=1 Tax=Nocardioides sp. (strain LMS-CY) TaxID=2840457 RepID=UPI001C0025E9|nr:hypothetical protein [Nocardioides sp. LMS-CY]QWF23127.1 hypothetical protein KM427_05220 [Nocardioides sp. LMS-CY]